MNEYYQTYICITKRWPLFLFLAVMLSGWPVMVACSTAQLQQAESIGASLVPLVHQGAVVATDAYAAYASVNQNLTSANVISGKLSAAKVLAGAQAIIGSSSTETASQSLITSVNTLVEDANSSIAAFKAAGATTDKTITAVSSSGAATVTAIAAVAPVTTSDVIESPTFIVKATIRPEYGSVKPESAYDLHVANK